MAVIGYSQNNYKQFSHYNSCILLQCFEFLDSAYSKIMPPHDSSDSCPPQTMICSFPKASTPQKKQVGYRARALKWGSSTPITEPRLESSGSVGDQIQNNKVTLQN